MASALRREIQRKLREIGFWRTFKLGVRKVFSNNICILSRNVSDPFDLKYGTDTSGIIKPGALDIPDDKVSHVVQYQTAIIEVFLDIMNSLPVIHEEFIFVDLGSGKGRALLLASQYRFKRIIGVELSATLHKTALKNIKIYKDRLQKCHRIESVYKDVTDFQIPKEKIVFYLFNPFDDYTMRAVVSNIEDSIRGYFRNIYIAYLKPVHRKVFDDAAFLQIVKETERYVIYKNKPSDF